MLHNTKIENFGVAELWDDFAQCGMNFQWFQQPIHPAFMQRQNFLLFLNITKEERIALNYYQAIISR
ncbi:hypothetical protein BCD64_00900 [Nostoc sp. MBR 210]|nr:hypothetical protein BCD64_00900 [Nostoc sp. MBR 210]